MKIAFMATIVTILGSADGSPPEARVVPNGVMTEERCASWKKNMENAAPKTSDISGKLVMGHFINCVPIQTEFFLEDIKDATANK